MATRTTTFYFAIGLCIVSGCSTLSRIQNCNQACPTPGAPNPAQLSAEEEFYHDEGIAVASATEPSLQAIEMVHREDMQVVEKEMKELTAQYESLQEQLAMLDKKMEKQAEERKSVYDNVSRMSELIESMQTALENHESALGGIESHLVDQHAQYETLLTGLERQLTDILKVYEEPEDSNAP